MRRVSSAGSCFRAGLLQAQYQPVPGRRIRVSPKRFIKRSRSAFVGLGMTAMVLPVAVFAEAVAESGAASTTITAIPEARRKGVAASGTALTQTGTTPLVVAQAEAPAAEPASSTVAEANPTVLRPVVVRATSDSGYNAPRSITATKTNTLLRDVPQSVTVLTQELIRDQSPRSMADAVRYVPGIGVSQGEGNRDALVFRGNRSTGDFFVDGIRDDVEYFRDLYNMDRVEVLKGPNGMIFGRGGSGGVINRVSKQANWDPVREVTLQGGSYGQKRFTTDLGIAINDKVAVRLNGLYEHSDSFRHGVYVQRYGVSPTVTYRPTDRTNIVLNMELFKDDRIADRGIPSLNGRPFHTSKSTFFGDPARSPTDVNAKTISLLMEHKFNEVFSVRNRTRYAIYDKFYQNVYANSAVNPLTQSLALAAYNNQTDRENFFNQTDFLLSFDTGWLKHDVATGVEVGRQVTDSVRQTGFFNNATTGINVSASNPLTTAPLTFRTRTQDANFHSSTSVVGVYIQDQIKILPQLQAILGVRYDRFEVDFHRKDGTTADLKTRDDLISPRFGLVFKPIEPVSIYGSYSLAYVPRAGDQLTSISVTNAALAPERFINIEAGVKWDIRPDLAVTTAFYQLDRSNVILADPNNAALTFLGKGQRVRGVEAGISGRITRAWSVMGGYTYQEGVLTQTQPGTSGRTGAVLAELPKHMFSIWNRYDFNPMWGVAVGVVGRSNMFAAIDNQVVLPDFARVDAALFFNFNKHLRAQVNIENLFDVHYIAAAHNNNNIMPGSPIAARAMVAVNF